MRKIKFLNAFSILLILVPMLSACAPSWKTIKQQRDGFVSQLAQEQARMDKAETEVKEWSGKFPAHYTTESKPQLDAAQKALADIGDTQSGWLFELNDAIEKKDRKKATERLEWIKGALDTIGVYTLRIMGPPESTGQGLYRELERKVERLHYGFDPNDGKDLKSEVSDLISPTKVFIDNAEDFKLCGSDVVMTYSAAWNQYNAGVASLSQAERQAEMFVLLPDKTAVVDEPAVSDWLVSAYNSLTGAMGEASGAKAVHKTAVDAIDDAESSKDWADLALVNFLADYYTTVSSEHSSGVSDLNNAYASCWNENFTAAVTSANNAKAHFDDAVYWSTQSKPEETSSDDDTWTPSGGGSDSGGDDGSWTPDYGGDDDSWDYGGDDGGSWDDGGGDDGSWDDGGSDDGSWDAIFLRREQLLPLLEWIQTFVR